jgi:glycosyltransferase involved in cell wall biosynthesis
MDLSKGLSGMMSILDLKATVIIPAYNEQGTISQSISDVKSLGQEYQLLVVDDGSTDDTAIKAKLAGAKVISHPYNKGYGATLKTGIENAESDIVLFFDADGQHDAHDIPVMIEMLNAYDMVVGDRSKSMSRNLYRLPGKWLLSKVANFLVGHRIPDLNSGFRCFRKEKAKQFLQMLPNGFSFSTTITLAYFKEGLSVGYVPVRGRVRAHDKSQVRYLRDGAQTLLLITRVIALFNPLKIFAPVGMFLIAVGTIYALYSIYAIMHIASGAVLFILAGIIVLFFGIIADQIAAIRRQIR